MEASELDKAVEYTKQFIEAATPVAKQAYGIGLTTIRIDAAQALILALIGLIAFLLIARKIIRDVAAAKAIAAKATDSYERRNWSDNLFGGGPFHVVAGVISTIGGLFSVVALLKVWTWVALFQPELWLARQAIQKLIN